MSDSLPTLRLEDLIVETAHKAGLSADQGWAVVVGALGLLDRYADPQLTRKVYDAVGGAEAAARLPEARPKAGGGLFGGVMKSAGGVSGKAVADAMGLMDRLGKQGVDRETLKRYVPMVRKRVREAAGADVLTDAVRSVPGVGALLGGTGRG